MLSIRSWKTRHTKVHNERVVVFLILLKQRYPISKIKYQPMDIRFVFMMSLVLKSATLSCGKLYYKICKKRHDTGFVLVNTLETITIVTLYFELLETILPTYHKNILNGE